MTSVPHDWDLTYAGGQPPPWDIGRPQPAFVRLAEQGLLSGRLLDVGCGTGENTLLAASHGADAMGVDVAAAAIERARHKASERGVAVSFEVADALALDQLDWVFDTVIDSGLFHTFDDARVQGVVATSRSD
jgi:2-polyprenyl-3-methyl-5-hydroxy-6-metoxy-1,4-benzoquinol methylase